MTHPVLCLGNEVPNFDAKTKQGLMNFHEWKKGKNGDTASYVHLYDDDDDDDISILPYFVHSNDARKMGNLVLSSC